MPMGIFVKMKRLLLPLSLATIIILWMTSTFFSWTSKEKEAWNAESFRIYRKHDSACRRALPTEVYNIALQRALGPNPGMVYRNQISQKEAANFQDLSDALENISQKKQVMIFPVDANPDYFEIALNLMTSLLKGNVRNFMPLCFQDIVKEQLMNMGIYCYRVSNLKSTTQKNTKESLFRGEIFKEKERVKFSMASTIVGLGYDVAVVDVDLVFLQNPFDHFLTDCPTCDMVFQSDQPYDSWNVGIMFAAGNNRTKKVLDDAIQMCGANHGINWVYQTCVNQAGNSATAIITTGFLDACKFSYFTHFWELTGRLPPSVPSTTTVSIHATYTVGALPKVLILREHQLFFLDTCNYYSNPQAKYILYQNPVPASADEEVKALHSALNIAVILRRKLILPKFLCFDPQYNNTCKGVHYVLSVPHIMAGYEGVIREHAFLENTKLVPESVRRNRTGPVLIHGKTSERVLGKMPGKVRQAFFPSDAKAGASEIEKWFSPYSHVSVLEFYSMYGAFGRFSDKKEEKGMKRISAKYLVRDEPFQAKGRDLLTAPGNI